MNASMAISLNTAMSEFLCLQLIISAINLVVKLPTHCYRDAILVVIFSPDNVRY